MTEQTPAHSEAVLALHAGRDVRHHFEILFRAWHRAVQAYFERQGVDSQTASDLTQEVFLTVLTSIGSLRDAASFRSWLFGIARFKLLQHFESKGRAKSTRIDDVPAAEMADAAPSGLDQALDSERRTKLREALEELPQQMRACVKLSVVEDLQYQEIASRLGVSVNSVKVQIHRARKVLAERLGPLFQICFGLLVAQWKI